MTIYQHPSCGTDFPVACPADVDVFLAHVAACDVVERLRDGINRAADLLARLARPTP